VVRRVTATIFHVYKAAQPYTCLGIEWLTQGGLWSTIFHV